MSLLGINPRSAGMKYYTIGLEFALSILFGWAAGRWLDGKFDSAPIGEILGFIFGLIAAFRTLFRAAKSMNKEAEAEIEAEEEAARAAHEQTAELAAAQRKGETNTELDSFDPSPGTDSTGSSSEPKTEGP